MSLAALSPLRTPVRRALRLRGFTLIELLVTLAVLAVLALAAVPLTVDWIHRARTLEARGLLLQGYAAAKAVALRNPCAMPLDAADGAAALQASTDGTTVTLRVTADGCNYLQAHPNRQWSALLPGGVALTLDGTLLDVATTPLTLALGGLPDAASATFTLSRGGSQNDETGTLH